jgi:uncharacterized protein (DUF488 family)
MSVAQTLFTIGHSTRTFEDFVAILAMHGVTAIADVRSIPKSRRYPHFADTALAIELPLRGIAYVPFKSLGGRRRTVADSPNGGWRNASFRGYADYMQTKAFDDALKELMAVASQQPTAIMCAEAVPWRCHRSLIGDAMLVRGWRVLDLIGLAKPKPHTLTPFAKVNGSAIVYPPIPPEEQKLFDIA